MSRGSWFFVFQLSLTRRLSVSTIQPMYILTRYVVWEVLKFFLAALLGLTLVVTLGMGLKEGLSKGFPAAVMLRTMPFMLPEMFGITIPVAMLYAVSSVFGRMTGANEVVALKSLGISPMAVVWPVIVLAAFLSLGTVWMYEIAATWCKPNVWRIGLESIEEVAYSQLQKHRCYDCDQFSIVVKGVKQPATSNDVPKLIQPTIIVKGPQKITLSAAEAWLRTDWKARQLMIICRQVTVDVEGQMRARDAGEFEHPIPIPEPVRPPYHRDWVAMREIPDMVAELQTTLRRLERLRDASRALGTAESSDDEVKTREYRRLIFRLKTEPYRRWANGFTCLCFALLGTPVAMLWRHADVLTNFFVCFLPILAVFYPLLMLGEDLSTSGKMWPISFWIANTALVIPAIFLLRWTVRH